MCESGRGRTLLAMIDATSLIFTIRTGEGTPRQRQRTPDVTRAAIGGRRVLSSRGSFGPTGGAFIGNSVKDIDSLSLRAGAVV